MYIALLHRLSSCWHLYSATVQRCRQW